VSNLPPDPAAIAPPIDNGAAASFGAATQFLYIGSNPIQTGVLTTTIQPRQAAVLRGKVLDRNQQPLPGVRLTVLAHPEFGQTLSRADGRFDLAVNGGSRLTVDYALSGYLEIQRTLAVPWQNYALLPDVVLTPLDPVVTAVNLGTGAPLQVARGSVVTDLDGSRQATVIFPAGTTATMSLPNSTTVPLPTLSFRATEYTVGETGLMAMPAELPPASAYTYAVELSADEAIAAEATGVQFSQPVSFYLDDFRGFLAGTIVPSGWYDRATGAWVAQPNGVVLKIVGATNGMADLDLTGDGHAHPELYGTWGITDAERTELAQLYSGSPLLWRVQLTHFSPYDCNWPYAPPPDAAPPPIPPPLPPPPPWKCDQSGSDIGCEGQTLGEGIEITGVPFQLRYASDRVPGRTDGYQLPIQLDNPAAPPDVDGITLDIDVAGRHFSQAFPFPPDAPTYTFVWDGKDAYDRTVEGQVPVTVKLSYNYQAVYVGELRGVEGFGVSGQPGPNGRAIQLFVNPSLYQLSEYALSQTWQTALGGWDTRSAGLGGWNLAIHHFYDPDGQVLYLGDGSQRAAKSSPGLVIANVAGQGFCANNGACGDGGPASQAQFSDPKGVTISPDGSIYVSDSDARVRKIAPDGIVTTVAGSLGLHQGPPFGGDGGPATAALLNTPYGLALGPDGSLYIADEGNHRVRKVTPDGRINTIAGNGSACQPATDPCGDGGLATSAQLSPQSLAFGPDGSLYVTDNFRVRRIGTDGNMYTVAGTGALCAQPPGSACGDGALATAATSQGWLGLAVDAQGAIYVGDPGNARVRRINPDGTIVNFAGSGFRGFSGDGGPATNATLNDPIDVAAAPDGSVYIVDGGPLIRRVTPNGTIQTVAGQNGSGGDSGDSNFATAATLNSLGIAMGPDGALYLSNVSNVGTTFDGRVRKLAAPFPAFPPGTILIPSVSGSEVYAFDSTGRHLQTLDGLTGAPRYTFGYDGAGRLTSVTDGANNVTRINHDAAGNPTTIVSPFGQTTTLGVDPNGYLQSVTNPAGEVYHFSSDPNGLLLTFEDPQHNQHQFTYDELGRLIQDQDPAGGSTTLTRVDGADGFSVTLTSALNRTATYQLTQAADGTTSVTVTGPNGLAATVVIGTDGSQMLTYPDGTTVTLHPTPDPRWGMLAPVPGLTLKLPSGGQVVELHTRSATLADPTNPLSLQQAAETVSYGTGNFVSTYTSATHQLTETSPTGRQRVFSLDNLGRVVGDQIGSLATVSQTYDSAGNLASVSQAGRSTSFDYDAGDLLTTLTDPLRHQARFTYDSAGRLTSITYPDGGTRSLTYDPNGNVATFTPPGAAAYTYAYSPIDQLASEIPPTTSGPSGALDYAYNRDRQLQTQTRPDQSQLTYSYDAAGRLSGVSIPGLGQETLAYDSSSGNLHQLTRPEGESLAFSYDGPNLTGLTWIGAMAGSVLRQLDARGHVISDTVDGANGASYAYDPDGYLSQAGSLSVTRDPQVGFTTGTAFGGVTTTFSHTSVGELQGLDASFNGSSLLSQSYIRDLTGRLTQTTETIQGTPTTYTYGYDALGRLTEVAAGGTPVAHYTYDQNGNRTSLTDASGTPVASTYDAQDRLLTAGTSTFTYNASGQLQTRMAAGTPTTYTYDAVGNLLGVNLPNGDQIAYVVDGANQRVAKLVNGTPVLGFLYASPDGIARPIAQLEGANHVLSRFVYATDRNVPDYLVQGSATYRIISDPIGSVRLVVNTATGAVAQRLDYDAFGNVVNDTNPGFQPFGFAGGIYDPDTKLVRFGLRDYDPSTGRWTAPDPAGFQFGGSNRYTYALDDPLNVVDPRGLDAADVAYSLGVSDWNLGWLADFAAGFGDNLTSAFGLTHAFGVPGLTEYARQHLGTQGFVNPCSGWHDAGAGASNLVAGILGGEAANGLAAAFDLGAPAFGLTAEEEAAQSAANKVLDDAIRSMGYDPDAIEAVTSENSAGSVQRSVPKTGG
jgi:RHS repeat-associated protein